MMFKYNIKDKIILDYIYEFQKNNSQILERLLELDDLKENRDSLIALVLSMERFKDDKLPLITNQSEEIKKIFWVKGLRVFNIENKNIALWSLLECRKYGSHNTFLELLFDLKEVITSQELYDELVELEQMNIEQWESMSACYLKEILKIVQNEFCNDYDKCSQISRIEIIYGLVLHWSNMKCTKLMIKKNPQIYADLISYIYRKDGQEEKIETDDMRKKAKASTEIFNKAHFCPAEKDGKVEYRELKFWVDEFEILLDKQKQKRLLGKLIGRLFTYSPVGDDNWMPCEAVCK